MSVHSNSILLVGESGVGKTHYGAQLLKRLMQGSGRLRMNGAATNLVPFEAAMERLSEGMAADHTATLTYVESVWPIIDEQGRRAELIWPDYGGEQIKSIIDSRRVPNAWLSRIMRSPAWLLPIRLQQHRVTDDIFSRPLADLRGRSVDNRAVQTSDQARLVELLQMMCYLAGANKDGPLTTPRLGILLTCWDELATDDTPLAVLRERLPLLCDYIVANWEQPNILGLSSLERSLSSHVCDDEYAARGPEQFGYVVLPDGTHTSDLTRSIEMLLAEVA